MVNHNFQSFCSSITRFSVQLWALSTAPGLTLPFNPQWILYICPFVFTHKYIFALHFLSLPGVHTDNRIGQKTPISTWETFWIFDFMLKCKVTVRWLYNLDNKNSYEKYFQTPYAFTTYPPHQHVLIINFKADTVQSQESLFMLMAQKTLLVCLLLFSENQIISVSNSIQVNSWRCPLPLSAQPITKCH